MMSFILQMAAVAVGGALGAILRYGINTWASFTPLPVGTVLENVLGSLLLGLLAGYFMQRTARAWVRAGLGAGFCGGFTTMSTFASDLVYLGSDYNTAAVLGYLLLSLIGGIGLAWAGYWAGNRWGQRSTAEDSWTS
ncbi:MAG: CrcB family protein [Dehalococcoidia bacterium]